MKLISFSGRKESGKDTLCDFLIRNRNEIFSNNATVAKCGFAKPMKDFAINYLGIPYEFCYGDNDMKNSITSIKWETLPHYYSPKFIEQNGRPTGYMSARQVLQQIGENMFLDMYPNIWIDYFKKMIEKDYSLVDYVVVCDPRKPEQIKCVRELGGINIRLTRNPHPEDNHISETILDKENYNWVNFDYVIDNANMSLEKTKNVLVNYLRKIL